MSRKIIQISTAGVDENSQTQCEWICTALCDDGSVWTLDNRHGDWNQLPEIPLPAQEVDK